MKRASRVYISRIREDQLRHSSRTAASIRAERYSNDYSTVTLLVRLRGGSTSVPLATNV